jgi:hypothetical protein
MPWWLSQGPQLRVHCRAQKKIGTSCCCLLTCPPRIHTSLMPYYSVSVEKMRCAFPSVMAARNLSCCSFCQRERGESSEALYGPLIGPYEINRQNLYFHLSCLYYSWDIWIDSLVTGNETNLKEFMKNYFIFPKAMDRVSELDLNLLLLSLKNVTYTYQRTRLNRCIECTKTHATVACSIGQCSSQYHFPCARNHVKFFYCSMAFILVHPLPFPPSLCP